MIEMDLETLQIITIVAGVLALIALGLAAWALARIRRTGGLSVAQRYEAVHRELEGLREQYHLLDERIGRFDRTHQSLRDDLGAVREEIALRVQRMDDLAKTDREQQEQIFELREENKVLMQRDDRLERTIQEVQVDLNTLRDGRRVPT